MTSSEDSTAELKRLAARVAELETELAAKPPIDRASLYRAVNNAPWGVMVLGRDGRLDQRRRQCNLPAPRDRKRRANIAGLALRSMAACGSILVAMRRRDRSPDLVGDGGTSMRRHDMHVGK